jgi:hypothetical protein
MMLPDHVPTIQENTRNSRYSSMGLYRYSRMEYK